MYELRVATHMGLIKKWYFIEEKYATDLFEIAIKCEDCKYVEITDEITGEILKAWHYIDGLTI